MTEKIGLESVFGTDQFQKGLKKYLGGIKTASVSTDLSAASMGKSLIAGLGSFAWGAVKIGAVAFAGAVTAAGVALASTIGPASDLAETTSKIGVVFGDSSAKVLAFAADSAQSLGMSQNAALGAAGTYGNLFRAMGLGEEVSADMSTSLVGLAADLASFNNMDPTEVLDKLRAGLSGETEPLRSLGVNLNAATIAAKAMEMGLVPATVNVAALGAANVKAAQAQKEYETALKNYGETSDKTVLAFAAYTKAQENADKIAEGTTEQLTAAQKAQASYALIMEQTTLAQGDFERTSGGVANQQRILAAELENVRAKIGTALLPIVQKFMQILSKVAKSKGFTDLIDRIVAGLSKFADIAGVVIDKLMVGDFSGALTAAFGPDMAGKITTVANALISFGNWLAANWQPIAAGIATVVAMFVVPAFIAWAAAAWTAAVATITALAPIIFPILAIGAAIALFAAAWNGNWFGIRDTLTAVWEGTLKPAFEAVWEWLSTNIPAAIAVLSDFWTGTLLPAMESVWAWIETNLVPLFKKVGELMSVTLTLATTALAGLWENVLQPAFQKVADFIAKTLQPVMDKIAEFMTGTFMPAATEVSNFVSGVLSAAFNTLSGAVQWVIDQIDKMIKLLSGLTLPDWLTPGSPTPFEIGLIGIGDAMKQISSIQIPKLTAALDIDAREMSPLLATAAGSTPAVTNNRVTNITNNLGGNNINSGMDAVTFEARVLEIVRSAIG